MTTNSDKPHHPLPNDRRARHDLLPESIEAERDRGDDEPESGATADIDPPRKAYRDPDGRPYET